MYIGYLIGFCLSRFTFLTQYKNPTFQFYARISPKSPHMFPYHNADKSS